MFERRRIMAALEDAVLAPSIHNSQPWRFRIVGEEVHVSLDASVTPRLVDPSGRWALASIGAVVAGLEIALAARTGHASETTFFPEGTEAPGGPTAGGQAWDGATLAVVRTGDGEPGDASRLAAAMPQRHTTREPLRAGGPTDEEWAFVLESAVPPSGPAAQSGLRAERAESALTITLVELTARADAERVDDPAYLAEVQAWIDRAGRVGIPHQSAGPADSAHHYPGRDFAQSLSGRAGDAGEKEFEFPPALLLVTTPEDGALDQVLGGYGMLRAMLAATALGLGTGVLGQALEETASHTAVDAAASGSLGHRAVVHQILRLGHPDQPLSPGHTQRRPVSEVVLR
ncbi:hypothetical protein [Miniimonas arenae]|uniref:hypothetical protein n=1 Tax=Miniimonas arenae TaxID=676201 RepID=UPI0028AAFE97|nr:hypothetical protein [Miniimonas arenae]